MAWDGRSKKMAARMQTDIEQIGETRTEATSRRSQSSTCFCLSIFTYCTNEMTSIRLVECDPGAVSLQSQD